MNKKVTFEELKEGSVFLFVLSSGRIYGKDGKHCVFKKIPKQSISLPYNCVRLCDWAMMTIRDYSEVIEVSM
jgi:hypothetical protein